MPARSVCLGLGLVTLSLPEAVPGRFGRQASVTGIYHNGTMPYHKGHIMLYFNPLRSVQFKGRVSAHASGYIREAGCVLLSP